MKTGQRYGYADKSEIVKGCVIEVCKGVVLNPKHGLLMRRNEAIGLRESILVIDDKCICSHSRHRLYYPFSFDYRRRRMQK